MKRLIWEICAFSSTVYEQDTDRISFSGVLYCCLTTCRFPFDFRSSVSFLLKHHLTSATNKVWTIFLPGASVDYCLPGGLSLMEMSFHLMEMKLQWKPDYSENPKLCRRKMTNWAFDKFRGQVLSLFLTQAQNFVTWKFLLLSSKTLTVTVDTAVALRHSYCVISNSSVLTWICR